MVPLLRLHACYPAGSEFPVDSRLSEQESLFCYVILSRLWLLQPLYAYLPPHRTRTACATFACPGSKLPAILLN
jgi:hypothetical protein